MKQIILPLILVAFAFTAPAQTAPYTPPPSPRAKINFDPNWKFIREDVPGRRSPAFDDSTWDDRQHAAHLQRRRFLPQIISHSGGDRGTYKGLAWYRKHFKLPASSPDSKVFLEFEGMRQAGDIFLNGKSVGLYENGVTAYGLDITDAVHFGDEENVLAVKVDNSTNYQERRDRHRLRMERQRLQSRPRRHQPACLAARDRQDLPDAAALLRSRKPPAFTSSRPTSTSPAKPPT